MSFRVGFFCCLVFLVGFSPCGGSGPSDTPVPDPAPPFDVTVAGATRLATTTDHFVSFTVDIDRLAGGNAHLDRPEVRTLAQALAPAVLRIGGSDADKIYYDLADVPVAEPPAPYLRVLHRADWDVACDFADELGLEIAFTLNAGDGPRDADGNWTPDAARAFIERSRAQGCPVTVWELGNEVSSSFADVEIERNVDVGEYTADFQAARLLLDEVDPGARLAGPASAYWPTYGEAGLDNTFLRTFVGSAQTLVDVVTWHYYPTESDAAPDGVPTPRPATAEILLDPENLDEVATWADEVESAAAEHAPDAEVWLGETASAQWGGQEGLSDTFLAGLWWVDELGLLAQHGQQVVARQSLTGGRYRLIDAEADTVVPYPDYYATVLWRRFMGAGVLDASAAQRPSDAGAPESPDAPAPFDATHLRVYAHCTPDRPGAVTVLAINLDETSSVPLAFPAAGTSREVYRLTAVNPAGKDVLLNGLPLRTAADGAFPEIAPDPTADPLDLPARSYAFVVLPDAQAPACR